MNLAMFFMAASVILALIGSVSATGIIPDADTSLGVVNEYRVSLAMALNQADTQEANEAYFRYDQEVGGNILYLYYISMDRADSIVFLVNLTTVDISGFDSVKLSSNDAQWIDEQVEEHFAMG
jgi:hypothetical protein